MEAVGIELTVSVQKRPGGVELATIAGEDGALVQRLMELRAEREIAAGRRVVDSNLLPGLGLDVAYAGWMVSRPA